MRGHGLLDGAGWAAVVGGPVPGQHHVRGEPGQRPPIMPDASIAV
jgi:hypothetical protein